MSVKINVHPALAHLTGGKEKLEVKGSTVGQCLDEMVARFPAIKSWLFAKSGKLNKTVEIYVNAKSSYPDELAMPVKDGDELQIVMIIVGG